MKNATLKSLIFCVILSTALASAQALACNPILIPPGTKAISFEVAKQQLKQDHPDAQIVYKHNCRCGSSYYAITDKHNNFLGQIELGGDEYQGNRLLKLAGEILKIPSEQITAVNKIEKVLREDIADLKEEFGVHVYDPSGMSLDHRFPGSHKQRFYVRVEEITGDGSYSSSTYLSEDLQVNVTELVPGRYDYKSDEVYQKGDLRKAFLADKDLFKAYEKKAHSNRTNGPDDCSSVDWEKVVKHLDTLKL